MNILQVNYYDTIGGAARIAWTLFRGYRERNHRSHLLVGEKLSDDPDVAEIPNDRFRDPWAGFWTRAQRYCDHQLHWRLLPGAARILAALTEPERWRNQRRGFDDFCFPATRHLLKLTPTAPDLMHLHNLHGSYFYFDLRELANLSRQIPTFVTLHDEWMMTGHCAYPIDCERWLSGCGKCPALSIYPAIRADGTARNMALKQAIYRNSRLHIACPSRWLLERARASFLAPGMVDGRVIPNGVDTAIFRPTDRQAARHSLGLPEHDQIVLFVGHGMRANPFKDHATIRETFLKLIASRRAQPLRLICVGEQATREAYHEHAIDYPGYVMDPDAMARYYAAADVYLHAAQSDNFPNTVIEASACGLPVVATAVGGISEQVMDGITGFLVGRADSDQMAAKAAQLLDAPALRAKLGRQGAERVRKRFTLDAMISGYLDWYQEVLAKHP